MSILAGRHGGSSSRYRCVQVIGNEADCCRAARDIAGRRFLSNEIPKLPLAGCDAKKCHCSYQLFDDRRTTARRDPDPGSFHARQQRTWDDRSHASSGRRQEDQNASNRRQ
ncbi:MAG: hypothetical protein R3192_08670 [Woeseiaceae bacterium]|nr:hypothetical protein [Woeseiaceae bacterium]